MFKCPKVLIKDNGFQLTSKSVKNVLLITEWIFDITQTIPQTNPSERAIYTQTMKAALRAYVEDNHKDWDKYLYTTDWMRITYHYPWVYEEFSIFRKFRSGDGSFRRCRLDETFKSLEQDPKNRLVFLNSRYIAYAYVTYSKHYHFESIHLWAWF